jgi:hypothetical protein
MEVSAIVFMFLQKQKNMIRLQKESQALMLFALAYDLGKLEHLKQYGVDLSSI